jgi:hypothetical protein
MGKGDPNLTTCLDRPADPPDLPNPADLANAADLPTQPTLPI